MSDEVTNGIPTVESDTATALNSSIEKWAAYLAHATPDGGNNCAPCLDAPTPDQGCEKGRALYAEYRLFRIEPADTTAET